MSYKKVFSSISCLLLFAFFFWASTSIKKISKEENTYRDTKKVDKSIPLSYQLPIIKPTGKTLQEQKKGSTTISVSVIPFEASRHVKQNRTVTFADITKPGYDVFEVEKIPYYAVSPEKIRFKLRVSNSNEDVPLSLNKITFSLFMDGTYWDLPEQYERTWEKGLVSSVGPKEYIIDGPPLNQLYASKEIMLNLSGVPTEYDKGGYVTKLEKFVWYFQCEMNEVQNEDKIAYSYETSLVETRKCAKCSGTGVDPANYKCSSCNGNGSSKSIIDGKYYKCSNCSGTGIVHIKCDNCYAKGVTYHPKSQQPPINSSETWNGWEVTVQTIPSGASIKIVDTKTGEYRTAKCSSPCSVDWYCTGSRKCPIIIEYNGQSVKVIPNKPNGAESGKVKVDFRGASPKILKGVLSN